MLKPGYKTTEFYITLATIGGSLIAAIANGLPNREAGYVSTASAIGYAVSRGLAKLFPPKDAPPPVA